VSRRLGAGAQEAFRAFCSAFQRDLGSASLLARIALASAESRGSRARNAPGRSGRALPRGVRTMLGQSVDLEGLLGRRGRLSLLRNRGPERPCGPLACSGRRGGAMGRARPARGCTGRNRGLEVGTGEVTGGSCSGPVDLDHSLERQGQNAQRGRYAGSRVAGPRNEKRWPHRHLAGGAFEFLGRLMHRFGVMHG
jgi:hypothetical protein